MRSELHCPADPPTTPNTLLLPHPLWSPHQHHYRQQALLSPPKVALLPAVPPLPSPAPPEPVLLHPMHHTLPPNLSHHRNLGQCSPISLQHAPAGTPCCLRDCQMQL